MSTSMRLVALIIFLVIFASTGCSRGPQQSNDAPWAIAKNDGPLLYDDRPADGGSRHRPPRQLTTRDPLWLAIYALLAFTCLAFVAFVIWLLKENLSGTWIVIVVLALAGILGQVSAKLAELGNLLSL